MLEVVYQCSNKRRCIFVGKFTAGRGFYRGLSGREPDS